MNTKALTNSFQSVADPKTKSWFDNYLQGSIEYRGLKSPEVKKLTMSWLQEQKTSIKSQKDYYEIINKLFRYKYAEDKFAGIFILSHVYKIKLFSATQCLELIDDVLNQELIYDWSTDDWLATRVTTKIVVQHPENYSHMNTWSQSHNLWQRRLAMTSFLKCPKARILSKEAQYIIRQLLPSNERFIQTAVGWYLATLSRHDHDQAKQLFEEFFDQLSTEVIDRHTKKLDNHEQLKKRKRSSQDTNMN